ncbi:hypothetical protein ART_3785 [Arthrobacter sp. PAMC 25486]|nr:hypothetical protein ART_3785 [Arthrobacter sp. PAMC 25486]
MPCGAHNTTLATVSPKQNTKKVTNQPVNSAGAPYRMLKLSSFAQLASCSS